MPRTMMSYGSVVIIPSQSCRHKFHRIRTLRLLAVGNGVEGVAVVGYSLRDKRRLRNSWWTGAISLRRDRRSWPISRGELTDDLVTAGRADMNVRNEAAPRDYVSISAALAYHGPATTTSTTLLQSSYHPFQPGKYTPTSPLNPFTRT